MILVFVIVPEMNSTHFSFDPTNIHRSLFTHIHTHISNYHHHHHDN